jgi:hypothetical protein
MCCIINVCIHGIHELLTLCYNHPTLRHLFARGTYFCTVQQQPLFALPSSYCSRVVHMRWLTFSHMLIGPGVVPYCPRGAGLEWACRLLAHHFRITTIWETPNCHCHCQSADPSPARIRILLFIYLGNSLKKGPSKLKKGSH